jgi:hypothetical protein
MYFPFIYLFIYLVGELTNAYKMLVILRGQSRRRIEGNIFMEITEIHFKDENRLEFCCDAAHWCVSFL